MREAMLCCAALLAGCSGMPAVEGHGTYTCVRVEALTATTTTVYVNMAQGGTVIVQPDCSAVLQVPARGVAL